MREDWKRFLVIALFSVSTSVLVVTGDRVYAQWLGGDRGRGGYLHVRPKTFSKNVNPYPKTGVWYHLVGTYDGQRVRFYVNGKLDGERLAETPGLRIRDLPNARMVMTNAETNIDSVPRPKPHGPVKRLFWRLSTSRPAASSITQAIRVMSPRWT